MPRKALFDISTIDLDKVAVSIEDIRKHNPQRYEFEQLSHICHFDLETGIAVGVLDIPEDIWWSRGHCPGRPLMPGVLMLECAAQLCSWFVHQIYDGDKYKDRIFGFGGIDNVKFRSTVVPPERLIIVGQRMEIRPRRAVFDTQGFLGSAPTKLGVEAKITGMWV